MRSIASKRKASFTSISTVNGQLDCFSNDRSKRYFEKTGHRHHLIIDDFDEVEDPRIFLPDLAILGLNRTI